MIKLIAHLSDVHIRTYKRHSEYKEILTDVLELIRSNFSKYDRLETRIVIVGDIVHQKITISNEQLLLMSWFLRECVKIAPTIIVAGNHDLLENNKDRMDSITPIVELLDNKELFYYKDSECYKDDNIIWCNYSIFHENKRPDIEKSRIENPNCKFVGLLHAPVTGSKTSIGYEFDHGIETDQFDGCDCVMLGDIHQYQKISHPTIPIYYPSSVLQQDYGESINNHGYLLWDMETLETKFFDVKTEYGFYKFKISSIDDIINNSEVLINV